MSEPPSAPPAPEAASSAADAPENPASAAQDPAAMGSAESSEPGSASETPDAAANSSEKEAREEGNRTARSKSRSERLSKQAASSEAASAKPSADSVEGYRVALPAFEGPLDLLLHLIEEHELDIRDIPIAFIAEKYVQYITLMEELNIDIASEYLVMAATLAYIKSRSLLPTPPAEEIDEEEVELDPRQELIRRLLEYQKYKHVAERLAEKDLLGRDVFPRGMKAPDVEGPAPLAGMSLFKLLDAFQSVLSRATLKVDHQIDFERFSISDRINEISDLLRKNPRLSFDELFEGQRTRAELIVTFLALLEMAKLRLIRLFQDGPLEVIYIELAVSDVDKNDASDELSRPSTAGLEPDSPEDFEASADPVPVEDEEPLEEDDLFGDGPGAQRFDADDWEDGESEFNIDPELDDSEDLERDASPPASEPEPEGSSGFGGLSEDDAEPNADDAPNDEDDAPEREPR
ncbi:MAG TPA: segregation/condensation protein A [Polyangiaceae bacterium]|nr:segregation/condensation protein A [Polyangiaceae bacterium]